MGAQRARQVHPGAGSGNLQQRMVRAMTVFLIIVSLYGGIERVPMNSVETCSRAAAVFNNPMSRTATAYCIRNAP